MRTVDWSDQTEGVGKRGSGVCVDELNEMDGGIEKERNEPSEEVGGAEEGK
jgi:hypothetical protein